MSTYPNPLPSGATWRTPLTRTLAFQTGIARGLDSTEQRWSITPGDESFELNYQDLITSDRDSLLTFIESVKGKFDSTWSFVFNGTTYTNCFFDLDKIEFMEQSTPGLSTAKIVVRQVRRVADSGSPGSFPALSSGADGAPMQLPYTLGRQYDVIAVKTEQSRSAWYNRATGFRTWSVGGPTLVDADALALWDHFRKCHGKLATFSMTDPDSALVYSSCRYGSDSLNWIYNGPRQNQIQATVEQFA